MQDTTFKSRYRAVLTGLLLVLLPSLVQAQQTLTLEQVIRQAISDDDWLRASEHREAALQEEAVFAGQLPDPRLRLGMANLPVDGFDLNQEPMTQLQLGISQAFPPGQTRPLNAQQKRLQGEMSPLERERRRALVTRDITRLWLQAWEANAITALITENRNLFEQLVEVADTRYRSAAANAGQQDVIRAELALTRLEDRLHRLDQQADNAWQSLAQWVPYSWLDAEMSPQLPVISIDPPTLADLEQAAEYFARHPQVLLLDKQVDVARTGVELAQQSYKPGFNIGASYGYREDGPGGLSRSDFFSLEFSMDLPLFTENRQRPRVAAASARASAAQSEWHLQIRQMFGEYRQLQARLEVLESRKRLYDDTLLPQMEALSASNLSAYSVDATRFEEVMRAHIDALDASVERLVLQAEEQQLYNQLRYLLLQSDPSGERP